MRGLVRRKCRSIHLCSMCIEISRIYATHQRVAKITLLVKIQNFLTCMHFSTPYVSSGFTSSWSVSMPYLYAGRHCDPSLK